MLVKNETKEEIRYTNKGVVGCGRLKGITFVKVPKSQTFQKEERIN